MNRKSNLPRVVETKINPAPEAAKQQFDDAEIIERFLSVVELAAKVAHRQASQNVKSGRPQPVGRFDEGNA